LNDVRLRFLLFETYKFAEAVVAAKINPEALSTLIEKRSIEVPLEFELDLHGVKKSLQTQTIVTMLADNQVSVASIEPLAIETALFDLDAGVKKLEESAYVSILPMGAVSFDFIFDTSVGSTPTNGVEVAAEVDGKVEEKAEAKAEVPAEAPAVAAAVGLDSSPDTTPYTTPYASQEPELWEVSDELSEASVDVKASFDASNDPLDDLSEEQCAERFEVLSQSGGIFFETASAKLDPKSVDALTNVIDVVNRCSQVKLIVAGHTDSTGSRKSNQKLSEQRAQSVSEYMISNKVDRQRLSAVGFGETKPLVPNNTRSNRERNRRIEFTIAE